MKIAIIGGGMAGFGAAHRLAAEGVRPPIYEKNSYHGGHAASFESQGFIFDDGPHISFTSNERVRELFAESVNQEYISGAVAANNYWRGHWIKHPVQCNLFGLPAELVVEIVEDFVAVRDVEPPADGNYADWLVATYGRKFAETFPMVYGAKYHCVTADRMCTEWLGPRMYAPTLAEVVRGALMKETPDVHYVTSFRYPARSGFVSFLNRFLPDAEWHPNHEVQSIDPAAKRLRFSGGSEAQYDALISSLPLPELVRRIVGAPAEVQEAARRLAWTSCITVNLGLAREDISEAHWTYFYDPEIIFARVSFPHMFAPGNVPEGHGSIQAEIYFSDQYKPMQEAPEEYIEPAIRDLRRCGLLRADDRIVFQEARLASYANVIFDLEWSRSRRTVLAYLEETGIESCGRYGRWGHHWTDEAFVSGEEAAQKILDRRHPPATPAVTSLTGTDAAGA